MKSTNGFLIRLIVLCLSIIIADTGRVIFPEDIHALIENNHNSDVEIPDLVNFMQLLDNDNWLAPDNQEFVFQTISLTGTCYYPDFDTSDYCGSIWQPPKSL